MRKFNIGNNVVLSNPLTKSRESLRGQTFEVMAYDGSLKNSYMLRSNNDASLDINVQPKEIELLSVQTSPTPEKVKSNREIFDEMNLKVGDTIKVKFKPTDEQKRANGTPLHSARWAVEMDSTVGETGSVLGFYMNHFVHICFSNSKSFYYPVFACELVKRGKLIKLNDNHDAIVTDSCVIINQQSFSFETFDKIQNAIKSFSVEREPISIPPLSAVSFDTSLTRLPFNKLAYESLNLQFEDLVKVVVNLSDSNVAHQLGCTANWVTAMDESLNHVYTVLDFDVHPDENLYCVKLSNGYWYNAISLERSDGIDKTHNPSVTIELEHEWNAIVHENRTAIGCQRFKNDVFPPLMQLINEVRAAK